MTMVGNLLRDRVLLPALLVLVVLGLLAPSLRDHPDNGLAPAVAAAETPPPNFAARRGTENERNRAPGIVSESDRKYQAARRAKRLQRIAIVAALVYLPPFLLLVVGWVISRIARGLHLA